MLYSVALLPSAVLAQREHRVRPGQSLARIARRYNVRTRDLAAANRLSRDAALRPGMTLRIPEEGVVYVRQGDTLARIARNHEVSVQELRRLNRIRANRPLQLGQRIVLPGHQAAQERETAQERWGRARRPGTITFLRGRERTRIRLVDRRGRVARRAARRLRNVMRLPNGPQGPTPPRRLIQMLARISDHFGGRPISLISGYRRAGGNTRRESRHTEGQALDIRIRGVANHILRDYVKDHFERVGVGYYPRGRFVHIDVRSRSAYWVDWSRSGEPPRYQRRGQPPPADATEAEVRHTGLGWGSARRSND